MTVEEFPFLSKYLYRILGCFGLPAGIGEVVDAPHPGDQKERENQEPDRKQVATGS